MKILLVSSSSGSHGGGEFYLSGLAVGLSALGHQPIAWLSQHSQMDPLADRFRADAVAVHRFDYVNTYHRRLRSVGAFFDRAAQSRIAAELKAADADLIHINQQCLEDGLDLVAAGAMIGRPVVSTIHVTRSAASLQARGAWLRDGISRLALKRSRLPLIGISPTSTNDLIQFLGTDRNADQPVYCVTNGVAQPATSDAEPLRKSLGLDSEDFVLGVIARIEDQKNPLFMCRLLKALPASVKCVWVGDGRLRAELESNIREHQLEQRFILAGWQQQASRFLAAFDVFCLPSRYEGLPLALLEAMAAGKPAVVSQVDGTQDAINDGVDGFLCPVDDVDHWKRRVLQLMDSSADRQRMGVAATARYESQFSLDAMARRTVDVYHKVVERAKSLEPRAKSQEPRAKSQEPRA